MAHVAVPSGATVALTWDAQSRLTGVTFPSGGSNSFTYNGLDQRISKADSTGAFSYTLADDRIDSDVLSDGAASYNHGLGLVSESRGGTSKFYHADALGTTRKLTDSGQGMTDTKETDAFGNVWTPGTSGTNPTPFGFAGQHGYQSDPDSGLMRLGYRYYDASTGRFLSRDPIQAGDNWYTYCDNDPVNAVDPEGLRLFRAVGRLIRAIGEALAELGRRIEGSGPDPKPDPRVPPKGGSQVPPPPWAPDEYPTTADGERTVREIWEQDYPKNDPPGGSPGGGLGALIPGIVETLDPSPVGDIRDAAQGAAEAATEWTDGIRDGLQGRRDQWLGALPGEE